MASRARKPTTAVTVGGSGSWRSARYTGASGSRSYRLYVPAGLTGSVPLLLALHGCGQDAAEFAAISRFNTVADRNRLVVCYPEQSAVHNPQHCWNWFRPGHQHRGAGEPAILAGIIAQLLEHDASWRIDPTRVYVLGLSAGGAMSVVLAATYPELFAAVGVHSAPPYRCATSVFRAQPAMAGLGPPPPGPPPTATAMPPMVVFQGTADTVVGSVNADRLAEQWLAYRGVDPTSSALITRRATVVSRGGTPATATSRRPATVRRWYDGDGTKVLEVWEVDGLGHAWSGGSRGSYSDPRGPRASTEMWRFLAVHQR